MKLGELSFTSTTVTVYVTVSDKPPPSVAVILNSLIVLHVHKEVSIGEPMWTILTVQYASIIRKVIILLVICVHPHITNDSYVCHVLCTYGDVKLVHMYYICCMIET